MKVLKNNYENYIEKNVEKKKIVERYPRKYICQSCGSELEYDKSDLRVGELGLVFLDCPLCGHSNILEDNEFTITLTKENTEFPTHFHHCSVETGAVDVCNNEKVKEYINKAIDYFRKNKNEFVWFASTGNLHITVFRWDGDECYDVIVTNDYYDTYIPFEDEDY